ncbi:MULTISPECIES: TetR/AcrR family transcriptional regulator [Alphaproteobacteria]|uniref:TetR family transcriptional regulator n=2 Tax=Alphaproteobacteria TaxID=28211 RepID=A0A512HPP8_9HYPH|nr:MULTISPECIES: TetR/AcrR family transcriptional regulator [Alphaproteobacteria]GEO87427.1 TetR family transcriptional regulator [Ciceribacter naphthalenivorans]GLR23895.1 TetR family transcriptional regulator [Ciceribacter naphthalenivorans]GLT06751.1 TetR family transcriptional regulator [Sphingomonas psychrolutea]
MARPLDEDKRAAILAVAAQLVAEQGLGAATAQIAKAAGVPHGSVFTYFGTKAELLNALYLELKTELTGIVLESRQSGSDLRAQLRHIWENWTHWGVANPSKRRALAQLGVSDQVSALTRKAGYEAAQPVLDIIWRISADGSLKDAPRSYVAALVEAMATTTMDAMSDDPDHAATICADGFEALWRLLN